jgi:hypothetical protein
MKMSEFMLDIVARFLPYTYFMLFSQKQRELMNDRMSKKSRNK